MYEAARGQAGSDCDACRVQVAKVLNALLEQQLETREQPGPRRRKEEGEGSAGMRAPALRSRLYRQVQPAGRKTRGRALGAC